MFRLPTIIYKLINSQSNKNQINKLKIGTHDGIFHCDEVTACVLLTKYSNKYYGADIVRTRNEQLLEKCDIIVDVGGKHQPPKYLDHHQRQFTLTHQKYPNIKLSSAGLVYWQFQQLVPNIIKHILQTTLNLSIKPLLNQQIQKIIRDQLYHKLILPIDGNDNGVQSFLGGNKNYSIPGSLWSRVGRLNPMWIQIDVNQEERFQKAMNIVNQEIIQQTKNIFLGSIQTYDIIKKYYDNRCNYHQSGQVLVLQQIIPWKQSMFEIQRKENKVGQIKFIIFPQNHKKQVWRVQAMPKNQGGFELRKGLNSEWRGIKNMNQLKQISQIDDIVFVHTNGFIGGARSFESALKMALISLKIQ